MICPCESGLEYADCCQAFVERCAEAPTAEALMRSRFTAYVLGEVDYLVATTHPSYRRADLKAGYQVSHDSVRWMGLRILATSQGQESDKTGKVEFEATYLQDGQRSVHCEKSRFKRYAGNWYYVDGVVNDRHPG